MICSILLVLQYLIFGLVVFNRYYYNEKNIKDIDENTMDVMSNSSGTSMLQSIGYLLFLFFVRKHNYTGTFVAANILFLIATCVCIVMIIVNATNMTHWTELEPTLSVFYVQSILIPFYTMLCQCCFFRANYYHYYYETPQIVMYNPFDSE